MFESIAKTRKPTFIVSVHYTVLINTTLIQYICMTVHVVRKKHLFLKHMFGQYIIYNIMGICLYACVARVEPLYYTRPCLTLYGIWFSTSDKQIVWYDS